jgi:pyruvate/2-oxoglutarate dehydrogenase complex dihydrolipoamide acyltransferase (E2) component
MWVDRTRLLAARGRLGQAAHAGELSRVTPVRAALPAAAGGSPPSWVVNATFGEEDPAISIHGAVQHGIATATERGLVAAVVRDADCHSISPARSPTG